MTATVSRPGWLGALARWTPSPLAMRRAALAALIANVGIALSGAVVRLTSSGLGCPNWPRCTGASLVPMHNPDHPAVNMAIEFGNRMLGVAVFLTVATCLVIAIRMRPRRRSVVALAAALPLGVLLQGIIGGLTVWYALMPGWVTAHFLGTTVMIVLTVWLYERASEGDEPPRLTVRPELRTVALALVAAAALVLIAGTVVTGTGPHAGDASATRYPFRLDQVAHVHATLVWVTVGLTVALIVGLRVSDAGVVARRRAAQVLGVEIVQGVIGYVQYFTGVPAPLVALHVLGACLLWVAVLRMLFATRERGALETTPVAQPAAHLVAR
ncbi:MAG: COX15/CtaA family protein [Streptosporangiales bacterium]